MDAATLYTPGATGYTGQLIARRAVAAGSSIILGGRNEATLRPLAAELGCEYRVARLEDPDLSRRLAGAAAVCHVAGPFSSTARPMIDGRSPSREKSTRSLA